jgi:tripartite motif-containing protein 2/3
VFNEDGQFVRRIGSENYTNFPNGIDISDAGDVLVGDSHGNRFHVAVFTREGNLLSEFECPYVKVRPNFEFMMPDTILGIQNNLNFSKFS